MRKPVYWSSNFVVSFSSRLHVVSCTMHEFPNFGGCCFALSQDIHNPYSRCQEIPPSPFLYEKSEASEVLCTLQNLTHFLLQHNIVGVVMGVVPERGVSGLPF